MAPFPGHTFHLITLFYRATIESIFTFCLTVWGGNCLIKDKKRIDKIIKRATKCTNSLKVIQELVSSYTLNKLQSILKDTSHPLSQKIITSNRSHRLISVRTKSERHRKSFVPSAIRLYNCTVSRSLCHVTA